MPEIPGHRRDHENVFIVAGWPRPAGSSGSELERPIWRAARRPPSPA